MQAPWTPTLDAALDAALDLEPDARNGWLNDLATTDAALAERVRALLARLEARSGFLGAGPAFTVAAEAGTPGAAGPAREAGACIGPWRLVERLGEGGMAEVWRAERVDGAYQREVALKLPWRHLPARGQDRFDRERDLLAALEHPGIARFYEAGRSADGQAWLAMEWVRGPMLLEAAAGLPLAERLGLLIQACAAVSHAHARLVVHRDLKPSNLRLDEAGRLRLLDFGIARLLDDDGATALTQHGPGPMTLACAAPEQLRGEGVTTACDVYALGLIGHALLAGSLPWPEATQRDPRALMAAVLQGTTQRPSSRLPDGPQRRALQGDLDAILLKAVAVEPAQRYASAQALQDDLQRHLDGLPVLARQGQRGYALRRQLRRHWRGLAAAAGVALALAGAALWAGLSAQAEHRAAARAQAMYGFVRGLLLNDDSGMSDLGHRDRRVVDLVVEAARRLPGELKDAPDARVELMNELATMLDGLGRREEAIALLHQSAAQAAAAFGPDSRAALAPLPLLAQFEHEWKGDYAGARDRMRQVVEGSRRGGETDHAFLGSAQAMWAFYSWKAEGQLKPEHLARMEAAVAELRLATRSDNLANDGLELLTDMLMERGRHDEALATGREAVAYNLRHFGRENWHTALMMEFAGLAAAQALRLDEAEGLLVDALAIQQQVWPAGNGNVARAQERLLQVRLAQGRFDEALALIDALEATLAAGRAPGSPRSNRQPALSRLDALARAQRWPAAQAQARLACAAVPQTGVQAFLLLQAQRCAQLAVQRGDEAEVQRWLAAGDALVQRVWPDLPQRQAWMDLRRADWAARQGRRDEAVAGYRAVLGAATAAEPLLRAEAWRAWAALAPDSVDRAALARDRQAWAARLGAAGGEVLRGLP